MLIENVGNLVCPALWDLGERAKVAILSVTEGDDKPAKYPDMFAAATLMLLNKVDLLEHVDFDVDRCIGHARRINPAIEVLQLSARRGDGMDAWLDWLDAQMAPVASAGAPASGLGITPASGSGGRGGPLTSTTSVVAAASSPVVCPSSLQALPAAKRVTGPPNGGACIVKV